ncbi:MAG TPA: bacteriohemerythrin [Desulfuromonadaceae bacterium]
MDCIEWTDDCSVGVQQFDEHHKHLFELLRNIYLTCDHTDQVDNAEAIVDELVDYATYHFSAEERLMDATGYFDAAAHQLEHQRFIQRVAEFQQDILKHQKVYLIELIGFLGNWLIHHIRVVDKKLGLHLNGVDIR